MKIKKQIKGIVRLQRTDRKDYKCVCCKGAHIYSEHIEIKPYPRRTAPGLQVESIDDFIDEFLDIHKEKLENKKVIVTIETVN